MSPEETPAQSSLGRGLAAVFARTKRRDPLATGVHEVPLEQIQPDPNNPRRHFDETALAELAESIRQHGVLQPLAVSRTEEGGYRIIAGERRWRASQRAGIATVPVVVKEDLNPEQLAELQLIENIQREDLNPLELADGYQKLIQEFSLTQEELARKVGKERSSIANALRLLTLPDVIREHLAQGRLSAGHAKALVGLPDASAQHSVGTRIVSENLTVRDTEDLVRSFGKKRRGKAKEQPPHLKELETNLFRLLGAPVVVKERAGRGSITVQFASKQSFQRIVEVLHKMSQEAAKV